MSTQSAIHRSEAGVLSLQGDCASPPTEEDLAVLAESPLAGAVALLPFQARQCLVLAHDDALPNLSKQCALPTHPKTHVFCRGHAWYHCKNKRAVATTTDHAPSISMRTNIFRHPLPRLL